MSPRARVWIVVGVAALAAAGTAVGVTLATRTDVGSPTTKPPPFVAGPDRAARSRAGCPRGAAGVAGGHGAAAADPRRSASAQCARPARARPGAGASRGRRRRRQAWQAAERVQPDSPSAVRAQDLRHPEHAAGPAAVRPGFTRARTAAQRHLLRGAAFQQALRPVSAEREFASGRTSRAERPGGADRRRRRPLRQGPPGARVLAARPARPPLPARADRPLPPRTAPDLLRRPARKHGRSWLWPAPKGPKPRLASGLRTLLKAGTKAART